jgi:hypothetical protein
MRERCSLDELVDDQIAFARRRRTDQKRLVSNAHMQRAGIGLGIDRDHAHPESLRSARDADGDLAAVGDQDGGEHALQVLPQGRAEKHGAGPGCPQAGVIAWCLD